MSNNYRKIKIWDKWVPVNRLSNFQLYTYSKSKETEVFKEDGGSTSQKIPKEALVQMESLMVRRGVERAA